MSGSGILTAAFRRRIPIGDGLLCALRSLLTITLSGAAVLQIPALGLDRSNGRDRYVSICRGNGKCRLCSSTEGWQSGAVDDPLERSYMRSRLIDIRVQPHFNWRELWKLVRNGLNSCDTFRVSLPSIDEVNGSPRWPLQTPPLMATQTPPGRTVEIVM